MTWPAIPDDYSAAIVAIHGQMEEAQWWSPADLAVRQREVLGRLLAHACRTVPFYRDAPAYAAALPPDGATPVDAEAWARLPILTRAALQDAGDTVNSVEVPADHLPCAEATSSGSTGRPITVRLSRAFKLFFMAVTLRDHRWHGRDPSGTIAVIRVGPRVPPEGIRADAWGLPVHPIYQTGPMIRLSINTEVALQARQLVDLDPDYLLTLPSNLVALAGHLRATGERLPRLREVRTLGEAVRPEVRQLCREVFGVAVADMYSAVEVGYIALQCPEHEHYHVQSEVTHVEVLDDAGRPCGPGETGRVVVTPLHNFAAPLIRYEVGDYAEVGEPCACGRGLPVITRVVGRVRNLLTKPTGERFMPVFGESWIGVDAIRQIQLVQHDLEHIQARIVGPRPLTAEEEATFTSKLQGLLGFPFRISFEYLERIDRTRDLKFEDVVSRVPPP